MKFYSHFEDLSSSAAFPNSNGRDRFPTPAARRAAGTAGWYRKHTVVLSKTGGICMKSMCLYCFTNRLMAVLFLQRIFTKYIPWAKLATGI